MDDMTYFYPEQRETGLSTLFTKTMFTLKSVWAEALKIDIGVNHDINISNLVFIQKLYDRYGKDIAVVNYPGTQPYVSEDGDYTNAQTLVRFEGMSK